MADYKELNRHAEEFEELETDAKANVNLKPSMEASYTAEQRKIRGKISKQLRRKGQRGMVEADLIVWYADQVENEIQCVSQLLSMQNRALKVIEMMIESSEVSISKVSNVLDKPELRVITVVRKG